MTGRLPLLLARTAKNICKAVTADVSQMTEDQHLLAAHCDAKGKMWSNLRLFRDGDGFAWIERRSVREPQLTELKNMRCSLK